MGRYIEVRKEIDDMTKQLEQLEAQNDISESTMRWTTTNLFLGQISITLAKLYDLEKERSKVK